MRIVFPEANRVELEQFEFGDLAAGSIRLRSVCSLMSTGTEGIALRHLFDEGTHWATMIKYPFNPGYATVGVVDELGADVEGFEVGQRVVTRAPHASHHDVAPMMCTSVPDGLDAGDAAWFAFAKIALMGARAAEHGIGSTVAVIGAGPIGQMALRWAVAAGARRVVVVDGFASRLDLARRGGATHVVADPLPEGQDAIVRACAGKPQVVIDSTGNAAVFGSALALAGNGGRVVLLGDTGSPHLQCLTPDLINRRLEIVGAHDTNSMFGPNWDGDRGLHELFFELVQRGRFDLGGLNTHTFSPEDCVDAYDTATSRRGETMGLVFDWTGV